jgi:hypothetical protein
MSYQTDFSRTVSRAANWSRYAAYISFVNVGLGMLQLIVAVLNGNMNLLGAFSFLVSGCITLIMSIHLLRFSTIQMTANKEQSASESGVGFYHMRIYFMMMGILFLISIGLISLFLCLAVIAGIVGSIT